MGKKVLQFFLHILKQYFRKAEKVKEKEKLARQKLKDAKFEKNKKNKKDKPAKDEYQKDIDYESGDEYDEARENREYYKQELGHEPTEGKTINKKNLFRK
jgi:hypothetical protein